MASVPHHAPPWRRTRPARPRHVIPLCGCLLAMNSSAAGLESLRALMKQDPAQAAATLHAKVAQKPDDPWQVYNAGVGSYAAGDYTKADETWQKLTGMDLPEALRDQTWLQIGNVSYRLAQPYVESAPDMAIPRLEQAREAFKTALAHNNKNAKAQHNLALVEALLEQLYARLAEQLAQEAAAETAPEDKIAKLEPALAYAQQAEALNPNNPERTEQRQAISQALADALSENALAAERHADEQRASGEAESINDARQHYEQALSDFREARQHSPENKEAAAGEPRVQEKLAQMLAEQGQAQLQQANQEAQAGQRESAISQAEQARQNFSDAQSAQPEHAAAKAGEAAARELLETLHVAQGDRQAQEGAARAETSPREALQPLDEALAHYEAAHDLAPAREDLPPKIEQTAQQLAEVLEKLGRDFLKAGAEAEEVGEVNEAVPLYSEALQQFSQAEEAQPSRATARTGREEAQAALERLRAQQEAPRGNPRDLAQSRSTFEALLREFKDTQQWIEQRRPRREDTRYREEKRPALRDW